MICSRCQANVDGSDYPHWQDVCWPCKATLDAREEADRLEKENRELRTKQQLSVSSNWGINCSQSVAEIENEELRAQLAAANERAEKAEAERDLLGDTLFMANDTSLAFAVTITTLTAERDALAARVAALEGALSKHHLGMQNILEFRKTANGRYGNLTREEVEAVIDDMQSALARTPAQSLAACKAAALREAAKDVWEMAQEVERGRTTPCTWEACEQRLLDTAERLEAEAARAAEGGKG